LLPPVGIVLTADRVSATLIAAAQAARFAGLPPGRDECVMRRLVTRHGKRRLSLSRSVFGAHTVLNGIAAGVPSP